VVDNLECKSYKNSAVLEGNKVWGHVISWARNNNALIVNVLLFVERERKEMLERERERE
jgi:hypothetical protein